MTKEEIYDTQINPLMAQVIKICIASNIAHVCSFAIPNEEDEGLVCTTARLTDECDPPQAFIEALDCIRRPARAPMMITTHDGSGKITRMDAILR